MCSLKTSLRGKAMHTITEHCWALLKWNCTTKHQVYQCLGAKLNTEVFVPACSAISSSIAYFHTISMSCRSIVAAVNYRGKPPLAHGLPARCRAGLAPLTPREQEENSYRPLPTAFPECTMINDICIHNQIWKGTRLPTIKKKKINHQGLQNSQYQTYPAAGNITKQNTHWIWATVCTEVWHRPNRDCSFFILMGSCTNCINAVSKSKGRYSSTSTLLSNGIQTRQTLGNTEQQ